MMLPRDSAPRAIRRLDYRPPAFLVDQVDLTLTLGPRATQVRAALAFHRNADAHAEDRAVPMVLDGEGQRRVRVTIDGVVLAPDRYTLTQSSLTLPEPPDEGVITIESEIDPEGNAALEGLYLSSGVFCTQCEPEGFRRIAYFPDRPDVLARYSVTLIADAARYPVLLANGNRVESGTLPGGRHFAKWVDPFPKPTYLFAVVAGDIASLEDEFVTMSGRKVALEIWSTPANLPRCRYAMDALKRAMRWDEERFGREYDLDTFMIFCADDFNMGAMENKGLNIFNSRLILADGETATDADFQAIEAVIGHEYFHNWSGNRVTCRDWFQLSLKEGLTVFRDQEFSSDMGSRAVERVAAVAFLRAHQFPEDAGPMAHPIRPDEYMEINNFYTKTVYEKGAEVIRMQHTLLGAPAFRRGTDLYFERHDGKAVTCDDFVQAMEDASLEQGGAELRQFRRWYAQAGTPVVTASATYDAAQRTYVLDVAQSTPPTPGQQQKPPLHVPLAVGLLGPDGKDLPLHVEGATGVDGDTTRVLHLTAARQVFRFTHVGAAPVPSLLRGFSAPVRLEFPYTSDELAFLAAHDSDPVNRWDAAQRTWSDTILALAADHAAGNALTLPTALVDVASHLLRDDAADPDLVSLALAAPDLAYLAGLVDTIAIEPLVHARRFAMRELASALRAQFERVYRARQRRGPYAPVQAQIGPRSLRNTCLHYVGLLDDDAARTLVVEHYDRADNMTDAIAALAAINDTASREREALFARFEARWRDDPLVLDKWFGLQATAERPDTLARVRMLLDHPKFNARNPNRMRALVAGFALRNWPGFHALDGSGYEFVEEQVLALDRINPHVSSGLASAFNHWRRFAEPRRSLQQRVLQRIADADELSPDLSEIVVRNLATSTPRS
jgi:aminopeptidase N